MKVLIFDTETTGLPKNQKAEPSVKNLDDWPYIVQMSWIMYDSDTCATLAESDNIIKLPDGIIISQESTNIHKITNEICKKNGKKLSDVIDKFMKNLNEADLLVAHNMAFDHKMLQVEALRNMIVHPPGYDGWYSKLIIWQTITNCKKLFCTMQETVDLCSLKAISKITGKEYVKFPTLAELHNYYFGNCPKDLHNALVDVMVCARCFHMLKFKNDICEDNIKFRRFVNKLY
jgi:DNA polymerase III epsilon subunit-like protein